MEVIRDWAHETKMPKARRVRDGNTWEVWGNLIVLQREPLSLPLVNTILFFFGSSSLCINCKISLLLAFGRQLGKRGMGGTCMWMDGGVVFQNITTFASLMQPTR